MRSLYLIGGLICRGFRGNSVPSWRKIVIFKAAIFLLALSPSWVMAEDAKVKENRLGLLQKIAGLANGVADLGKLEGF